MTTVKDYEYHDWRQLKMRREQCMKKESEIDETRNKKTNWRHFFIICSVLISAYLINGEHAQTVCNICTTVPAAIFTYEQLSDHATRIFAYKATLFYWSIHGILIAFDSIFVDAFGYFFGKFILLVVLFFNVVYQHDVAKSLVEQQQRRNAMANSMVSSDIPVHFSGSPYASQIGLNTAMTITDATQFSAESLFRRYPSLHYNNLTTAYSLVRSPEMTAYLDTSYTHDGSLKTVASTAEQFKFGIQKHRQITLNDSSILSDSGEENDGSENDAVKSTSAGECQKADNEACGSLHSSEYSTSMAVKEEEEETLITNPNEFIIFKHPFTEMVTIHVKNKHSRPIMWALKTNAIKRMIAQPTCGTLGKDATVHIKIGVTAVPSQESNMNDRAAIDYCLIDDDTTGFDRSFLYNTEDPFRRRKKFNIYYEN
uniref:Major sperm protein n=1 Tax=Wuchereria bancrofti TaxID=6293 RepID=A0AAF5Q3W6_WUCBA